VEQQREPECQGQKDHLPRQEEGQLPPPGARDPVPRHSPRYDVAEVIVELPLDGQEPVQRPEVIVLPAVEPQALLVRRQPPEEADVNVGVVGRTGARKVTLEAGVHGPGLYVAMWARGG
jgi:hypothetical protein